VIRLNLRCLFGFILILFVGLLPLFCSYLQTNGPDFIVQENERIQEYNSTATPGNGKLTHLELTALISGFIIFGIGFYNICESSAT
jgi:hypothetical protein